MGRLKKLDSNVVSTKEAVAKALNIPVDHVKACKKLGCSAAATSGRYYLKELQSWYDKNLNSVLEFLDSADDVDGKDDEQWKGRRLRANALLAEIQLADRQATTLDKDKVLSFLKQVAGSQAILLRNMAQELPHRLLGKNITEMQVEISKTYDAICNLLKEPLEKWK